MMRASSPRAKCGAAAATTASCSIRRSSAAGPTGEVWRLEENLAPLLADCRKLLDANSRFLVLTVYAVRMSALAIGELVKQLFGDLGGTVEMGEMAVREEARGLLLPTAIFARWSRTRSSPRGSPRRRRTARRRSAASEIAASSSSAAAPFRSSRRAEDQQRHRERQQQQAGERARARQACGDRGNGDRERGQPRRSDRQRDLGSRERRAIHREQGRGRERSDQQQRPEGQPMRDDLGGRERSLRRSRGASSWSRTPSARSGSTSRSIGSSAAVSAAIHKAPRADPLEQARIGPDRERHQRRDQQEEGDREPRSARRIRAARRARSARQSSAKLQPPPVAGQRLVRSGKHRAARCAMRARSIDASRSAPSASSALSGSSSSHSGASDAATRASVARLAWPDDSSRTGTSASSAMPSASIASSTGPRPEAESARHSGSSRSSARLSSASATAARSTRPALGAQQARGKPDQARLAAAVRASDVQRLAGGEREIQAFEQQPPAAAQRHVARSAAGASRHARLRARACRRR